jgi:superfamily II DNA or RNA helicase
MALTPRSNRKGRGKSSPGRKTSGKPIRINVSQAHKLDALNVEDWQRLLRTQYGEQQDFRLENLSDHPIFSEFALTNPQSQKTYRVAIRGEKPGDNYCSCPDFRINELGTCKHIAFTLGRLMARRGAKRMFAQGYTPPFSEVFLTYGPRKEVRFRAGEGAPPELISLAREYFDDGVLRQSHLLDFPHFLRRIPRGHGHEVRCYDDVLAYVAEHQDREHRRGIIEHHLDRGVDSTIMKTILKTNLFPYQKTGALFALQTGRCLIGDDMGLGKTVQALAASELMARLFHIGKVLIVSPTSLKYQWKGEIEKFTDRSATVIEGLNRQRRALYEDNAFYKLVNYELVWRDMELIRRWAPDLIILDEAQRIKNWKTRTAKYIKQLESPFAIVLTGTPIENRIEEIHSIMEFVDRDRFGPLYRFLHTHRILDEGGKVVGYRRLESVRQSLEGVMIRRKKEDVLTELPGRMDKYFFVPMTSEQREIHDENHDIVVKLVVKWRRYKFLSEADQRRMQIALGKMRMAADNTYLVDRKTNHGPKLDELAILLKELVLDSGEKVVIFSQWVRMTELVERVLQENGIGYVHLNGMVPSKDRKDLMKRFREDGTCMVFLSTDAGGLGLNLQSGSVVINMDIPWNPAVLEQRIGRVHRLGQGRPVRVVNFVTRASIEERIMGLLKFKKALFEGALDEGGEDVVMIGEGQINSFMETLEAVADGLQKPDSSAEAEEKIEIARDMEAMTGEDGEEESEAAPLSTGALERQGAKASPLSQIMMRSAEFLAGLGRAFAESAAPPQEVVEKHLQAFVGKDEATGKAYLKIPLPEPETIQGIFSAVGGLLAGILAKGQG